MHQRYTRVAIALHWVIAALIIFNLAVGFFMEGLKPDWKGIVVPLHISCGLTVFALTLARIAWRLTHPPPPLHAQMAVWEKTAAHVAHGFIYLLMIAMPLSGWSIISAHPPRAGAGPKFFGTTHIPPIPPIARLATEPQKAAHDSFVVLHSTGGWAIFALLILHVSAACKHQFFDRQRELQRMGIGRR